MLEKHNTKAYKFLKKNEKYDYFAQEHSVTKAFNEIKDQFKSDFARPLEICIIKQWPSYLVPFKEQLGGNEYPIIYSYQMEPELSQYLQDLPQNEFKQGRSRSLHDAVKSVKLGINFHLASLFHNDESNRKYVLLIDLVHQISNAYKGYPVGALGGAGRLDQAFEKMKFPNMRETGLADLRDANVLYYNEDLGENMTLELQHLPSIDHVESRFFYQMHGLSNILLVDMLILAERYQKRKCCNGKMTNF